MAPAVSTPTLSLISDEKVSSVLETGALRLLSVHWFLFERQQALNTQPLEFFASAKLPRRQDLEALSPSPFLSHRDAATAFSANERRVFVLTYGWGAFDDPDPLGVIVDHIEEALLWLAKDLIVDDNGSLDKDALKSYGLFWDYPCLYQKPRTADQDRQFGKALDAMIGLYASPLGTCALQHKLIPPRPSDLRGNLIAVGLPEAVEQAEVQQIVYEKVSAIRQVNGDVVVEPRAKIGEWSIVVPTHEVAVAIERQLCTWVASRAAGMTEAFVTLAYNEREYENRGWCFTEQAMVREVVGRAQQPGFEDVRDMMDTIPIAKLYEISLHDEPEPIQIDEPQDPSDVVDGIRSAHFTSGGDREKVVRMYWEYRREAFEAMDSEGRMHLNADNTISSLEDEQARFGMFGLRRRRAQDRSGLLVATDAAKATDRRQTMQNRADYVAALHHTIPIGLIQLSDFVSDLFVLLQFRDTGQSDSFHLGLISVVTSVVVAWLVCLFLRRTPGMRKHALKAGLLAPLNLHVLYFGLQHAELNAKYGDELAVYSGRKEAIYATFTAQVSGLSFFWGPAVIGEYERAVRTMSDALDELDACKGAHLSELQLLYRLFVAFKLIETTFESVVFSILTAASIVDRLDDIQSVDAVLGSPQLMLLSTSLMLSIFSMTYGFVVSAQQFDAYSAKQRRGAELLRGRSAAVFVAVFVHISWALLALGCCWNVSGQLFSLASEAPELPDGIATQFLLRSSQRAQNLVRFFASSPSTSWNLTTPLPNPIMLFMNATRYSESFSQYQAELQERQGMIGIDGKLDATDLMMETQDAQFFSRAATTLTPSYYIALLILCIPAAAWLMQHSASIRALISSLTFLVPSLAFLFIVFGVLISVVREVAQLVFVDTGLSEVPVVATTGHAVGGLAIFILNVEVGIFFGVTVPFLMLTTSIDAALIMPGVYQLLSAVADRRWQVVVGSEYSYTELERYDERYERRRRRLDDDDDGDASPAVPPPPPPSGDTADAALVLRRACEHWLRMPTEDEWSTLRRAFPHSLGASYVMYVIDSGLFNFGLYKCMALSFGFFMPLIRRLCFLAMAGALLELNYSKQKIVFLGTFQALDLFASTYILFAVGIVKPPFWMTQCGAALSQLSGAASTTLVTQSHHAVTPLPVVYTSSAERSAVRTAATSNGYLCTLDMLDSVLLTPVHRPGTGARHISTRAALRQACVLVHSSLPLLSQSHHATLERGLENYLPSSNGVAEGQLLRTLKAITMASTGLAIQPANNRPPQVRAPPRAPSPPPGESRTAAEQYARQYASELQHPMRGVLLAEVLQSAVWRCKDTVSGPTVARSSYELSYDVPKADYFISHTWTDNKEKAARKLGMLREFLCLQTIVSRALVTLPLLALFLVPLGLGINSKLEWWPWWSFSLLSLIALVLVIVWVIFASMNLLPLTMTPWAFSSQLVWLDTCCLDQGSPEAIEAGVRGLHQFVSSCDKMIAFVSPAYFRRLWTVFELATFCKVRGLAETADGSRLESKLLLLSLDWPWTCHPCKRRSLSDEEIGWLAGFSCLDAQCYKPSDRALLLSKIRNEWGSEDAFDEFVRTDLLRLLARSKKQYEGQAAAVAKRSIDLIFGD